MSIVYVIMVYGMLGNLETMLPGSFPTLDACQAAVVQTHLTFGNVARCEPLNSKTAARLHARYRHVNPPVHHHHKTHAH